MQNTCADLSLWLTLEVVMWATLLQLTVGTTLGWLLARKRFFGKGVLDVLVMLPLIFPPIVIGYVLLMMLGRNGWLMTLLPSFLQPEIIFQTPGLVIAAFVAGLPLMVKSVQTAFMNIPDSMRQAAAGLGADPWLVVRWVDWPLARRGIAAGLMLSCGRSLGEVGISLMLGGNIAGRTETLSLAIYNSVMDGQFSCANYLSLLLAGMAAVMFFLLKRYGMI